ncbi:MAG: class I SAM-dependent methyltransferase, partial [bacterium]|nr:class I SAM-dependent methyltransferase [bacterium]
AVQNKNIKYLLLIPAIFFIIHTGYGIGFLCGAIESLNRNNFIRKIELHIRLLFPHYQHREKNLLLSIIQGRGLDIGCGAEKVSPSCIGIDIIAPGEKGRFGSQKGKISVADYVISGDNLHIFKDEEFDFIVAKHNLEHYSHPDKTLMEWKRVLKKGGKIGVIVPDDRYVDSTGLDPTHKVSFTLENLEELFKNKGFIILASGVAIKHWSIYLIAKKPEI